MKKIIFCFTALMLMGCYTRTEYVYLSAEKEAQSVKKMIEEYCSLDGDVPKKLVTDQWLYKGKNDKTADLSYSYHVLYSGTINSLGSSRIMIIDHGLSSWPGINFPLIAIVENEKIISSYYETSSDIYSNCVYDNEKNQLIIYLMRRSGGMRELRFIPNKGKLKIVEDAIYKKN